MKATVTLTVKKVGNADVYDFSIDLPSQFDEEFWKGLHAALAMHAMLVTGKAEPKKWNAGHFANMAAECVKALKLKATT